MFGYGALVKAAREAEKISQTQLAAALGLEDHSAVSRIESERKVIEPDVFARLIHALGSTLSPSELVVAMGYQIEVAHRDAVPADLAEACAALDLDQRRVVTRVAKSLRAERPRRTRGQS